MANPGDRFVGTRRDKSGQHRQYVVAAAIASGGEGTVYRTICGEAMKLYHNPPDQKQQAKIGTLVRLHRPSLAAVSAWPQDVLFDANRAVVGFVMPLVRASAPLHKFITPMDRLRLVPHATYADLVALAANLARVVVTFHQAGIVIGDVNTQNILVDGNFTVILIDCDSYQVKGYPSDVGIEEFLAPELQGKTLSKVTRTESHDAFTLAMIIFLLLVIGKHPFAGSQAATIGDAIKAHDYMLKKRFVGVDPLTALGLPPQALFTPRIATMFERAFGSSLITGRPTALEWMHALEDLLCSLADCPANASHRYAPTGGSCPWCGLERAGLGALFQPTQPSLLWPSAPTSETVWWKPWTWW